MLDLKQGGADLSRRVIEYHLPVWSFREYLNLRCGWQLKTATLDEVLKGKVDFPYGAERPLSKLAAEKKERSRFKTQLKGT